MGTGFVATRRAAILLSDPRAQLRAVVGYDPEQTQAFADQFEAEMMPGWRGLVQRDDLDLVIISHINRDHGPVAAAALAAGKHVVVEYPLALDPAEAVAILSLARRQQRLLHVAHIELLGGLHRALKLHLAMVRDPFYVRYSTLAPRRPPGDSWTYCPELFGFPLVGALSRIHRLVDGFGNVSQINSRVRYFDPYDPGPKDLTYYRTYLCTAQLDFTSGLIAEVTYGKGASIWLAARQLQVQGQEAGLRFEGEQGWHIDAKGEQPIVVGTRRGLIGQDTCRVLDYLTTGAPLYCRPEDSLYSLQVADAARRSAAHGQVIDLSPITRLTP